MTVLQWLTSNKSGTKSSGKCIGLFVNFESAITFIIIAYPPNTPISFEYKKWFWSLRSHLILIFKITSDLDLQDHRMDDLIFDL